MLSSRSSNLFLEELAAGAAGAAGDALRQERYKQSVPWRTCLSGRRDTWMPLNFNPWLSNVYSTGDSTGQHDSSLIWISSAEVSFGFRGWCPHLHVKMLVLSNSIYHDPSSKFQIWKSNCNSSKKTSKV